VIVAFSTSSPQASVALLSSQGEVLWSGRVIAPMAASGACLALLQQGLEEGHADLKSSTLFVADLGPGSFTGVRVGVTLAKTLAYVYGVCVAGVDAFDLVAHDRTVVLPNKRGEWFVREPGEVAALTSVPPTSDCVGFGSSVGIQTYPEAINVANLLTKLVPGAPEGLIPRYLVDPSISKPRKPFGASHAS
jgi:tRNA threonylcarbamoyladenosine biosynthesis protein TsaB